MQPDSSGCGRFGSSPERWSTSKVFLKCGLVWKFFKVFLKGGLLWKVRYIPKTWSTLEGLEAVLKGGPLWKYS